ncbi:natriuretic peptide A-like [Sphaeramia orbicularis]|uniref:C-type natriuretic peptide 3-like n=1 Tax=Sphaeramia orbicularis TaxID=375764 RepID=A0A673BIT5_9TELE|nr:C-type natriuretic peptide 3-like [Sphaeramia orbicularis]
MSSGVCVCCVSVLVVLSCITAKPVSTDLQSLKQLLEEELNPGPFYAEDADAADERADRSVFGVPEGGRFRWDTVTEPITDTGNSAPDRADLLARLFKDLMRTTKRSWTRSKKGGMRSCFVVRLERIGSFSGLGC